VCPEPSVYPENNVTRHGVTVVPSPESGLGPITYTPTAPSFTGAVHIVANYIIPDDPPKPWHESWDYVYLVGNPVPVLTQYYSENGNVMGLQFTMGMGSDTENMVLPRTLGGWHFISNNNMAHSDDIINMRELSIKDPVTFVADDNISNKIKVQAGIEELPTGSWTANIARAKDVIVDPDTQETTTIDLIWDPATKYLAGDWIYNSGVITAALSKGFSLTAREIADSYMHTIIAYEDTVKTFASKSAGQEIAKLTIENVKIDPNPFNSYMTPYKTKITADIISTDPQQDPSQLSWEVVIYDSNGSSIKHFPDGQGNKVFVEWDGKDDLGKYIFYKDVTEPSRTIDKYIKEANYTVKINAKDNSSCLSASKTDSITVNHHILDVIQLLQTDSRWSGDFLDHLDQPGNTSLIGGRGCALCSFSMMASFYSSNPENPNFHPDYVNNWLKLNDGFTEDGALKWGKMKEFSNHNNGISQCEFLGFADTGVVLGDLFKEQPVILFLPYGQAINRHTHFTVCKGKVGEQYLLSDTVNGDFTKDWEPFYGSVSALRFKRTIASDHSKNLAFYGEDETGDSVQYAVTDPQGRYLGYEPSKALKIEQAYIIQGDIPNAQYAYLPLTGVESDDFIGKTKILWLYKPIDGVYTLKIFGIDASERYSVDVESDSLDGDSISLSGYMVPGQSDEYTIEFSQIPGSELVQNPPPYRTRLIRSVASRFRGSHLTGDASYITHRY